MTTIAAHTTWMTQRQLKALAGSPPTWSSRPSSPPIWLFLFGSLFRKVAELPGFGAPSYLDYLVPGVVVMSALSTSMWSGMAVLEEIDRGIMDRFLVLPLRRSAIINASVVMQSLTTALQSLIIVGLGLAAGARYTLAAQSGWSCCWRRRSWSPWCSAPCPTPSGCWPGSGRPSSGSACSCSCR